MPEHSLLKAKLMDGAGVTGRPFFPIEKNVVKIGRSKANDIVIKKITVSGRHAIVKSRPDGWYVMDLNSTNKTLVNGAVLAPNTPKRLDDGDEITIDKFSFVFRLEKPPPPPPPPAADDDETIFFDDSAGPDDSDPHPVHAENDPDATVFFDDSTPPEEKQMPPPRPAADDDETVFFDSSAVGEASPSPPPPAPGDDETVFFDSSELLEEEEKISPPQPAADSDETVFFDSSTLMEEEKEIPSPQPAPDSDETVFFDSSELVVDDQARTAIRPEAPDAVEITKIGTYEVVKLLGKGGFGSVWKALAKDGRPVAVKVLNSDVLENERAVRKFFHEAVILSKLDHPNICQFIDFFPQDETYAIVMDFVEGTDLKSLLEQQKGPLPHELACRIASQALDGFHYAHQKQVLHRDIKPENIILDSSGTARIMDFGIARLSSSESHQTSLFMISPAYTAPERFDAKKTELVDHRADIYSLGLVFYELFTGTHPFQTTNPTEMIIAHLNTVPPAPEEIADVPPEISDAIRCAIEKDPDDRHEDFAAFKMAMLGQAPQVTEGGAPAVGALVFSGAHCTAAAKMLKMFSGILKKHRKRAARVSLVQEGTQIHLTIETEGGNPIRVTRDLETIVRK